MGSTTATSLDVGWERIVWHSCKHSEDQNILTFALVASFTKHTAVHFKSFLLLFYFISKDKTWRYKKYTQGLWCLKFSTSVTMKECQGYIIFTVSRRWLSSKSAQARPHGLRQDIFNLCKAGQWDGLGAHYLSLLRYYLPGSQPSPSLDPSLAEAWRGYF